MEIYFVKTTTGLSRPYSKEECQVYSQREPQATILRLEIKTEEVLERAQPLSLVETEESCAKQSKCE